MAQGFAPKPMLHVEALHTAHIRMDSAQTLVPTRHRPRLTEVGVKTSNEVEDSSTLQASTSVKTKVKPWHKEPPCHSHESDIGEVISSAVASFLANPEVELELDDSSGEQSDQGEGRPSMDSGSCYESSRQAEDVTDDSVTEELTDACPALATRTPLKGKVDQPSYRHSNGSSSSSSNCIQIQIHQPDSQTIQIQCLERGSKLCQKLRMLRLPARVKAKQLGLRISIVSCIQMLYQEKRKPTLVAVQQKLRERNYDEVTVQSLLPMCARMPDLCRIWMEKDSQVCLLLGNKPLSDANLDDPSEVEAQCTPAFLEALIEVINIQQRRFQVSTSTFPAHMLAAGVGPETFASSASSARPMTATPPGLFHAVGSP
eukprot:CAMPEP_0172804046 /NCGR_PEP_ID=MMETSP1075-20121228/4905_1 /TAXON_ID=2916 /ORGANISM="Ceratium fusus, Strain PA161109" /LENGTH=371 /DNA_ID=CAMNT_0013642557 /DNA_START=36 /DNA_END=1147 /DNA_ORIENTATION=+